MFLRVSKGRCRDYVVIVRGYRDQKGKPRQKTIKNLGSFKTEEEKNKLYLIGHRLIADMEGQKVPVAKSSKITELSRCNWGGKALVNKLVERFSLDKLFNSLLTDRKIKFDLLDNVKFLVTSRLLDPCSKLAAFNSKDWFGYKDIELHHLYRTLDELNNYEDAIKEHIFKQQKRLTKDKIEVVLFDVTTLYFESKRQDELRDFGYSKDCKFGEVQVVLSLMVSSDGRPLGYEVFPGNSFEGNCLIKSIKVLQNKYNIKKVTVVADRGMSSANNLQHIRDAGFDFCVGFRIKAASKKLQREILNEEGYEINKLENGDILKYKTIDNGNNKLLCIYSSKRADKDRADREKMLIKAEIMLAQGSYKRKSGAKKYLKMEEQVATEVLYDKAYRESEYDGFYAISYSEENGQSKDILDAYHSLWRIEESFRGMKHFLETRPMFHWSESRIKGHIALNFISLAFERELEMSSNLTQAKIRKALYEMQVSRMKVDETEFLCYSNSGKDGKIILDSLKIKLPNNQVVNT
ncbi:MAG: IS1634 family transposase [Rickettsiaceae bacterium]|nr:IS1634 family transposase [Rickettsiaceae bacterium]